MKNIRIEKMLKWLGLNKIFLGIILTMGTALALVSWYAVDKTTQVTVLKNDLAQAKDTIEKMRENHLKTLSELNKNIEKIDALNKQNKKVLDSLDKLKRSNANAKKFLNQRVPDSIINIMFTKRKNKIRKTRNTRKINQGYARTVRAKKRRYSG